MSEVAIHLFNEFGDHREITLLIEGDLDHGACVEKAEQIAAENNPPPSWPAGVPHGTWKFWKRDHNKSG